MAEVRYLTCPMCGMNKPLRKYMEGDLMFTNIDPDGLLLIQIREGGGRGSGFRGVGGFTTAEVKGMPEYQEIIRQIRDQCNRILSALE